MGNQCYLNAKFSEGESAMHNLLVALAFVAMVACPVFVAAMPQHQTEDEA
jgi:hypothetical protein